MQCPDDGETSVEIGKSLELRTLNVQATALSVSGRGHGAASEWGA